MKLSIVYKNGESRHINLSPVFFLKENSAALDKRTADLSLDRRVVDLANDLGKSPYTITVIRGAEEILQKRIVKNEPPLLAVGVQVDERDLKKKLRREFKRIPFTQKIILSNGQWVDIGPQRKAA